MQPAAQQRDQPPFDKCAVDIVVADDEDICRAAAASALKRFGFARVHEAENGNEALQKIRSLQDAEGARQGVPLIVLLDCAERNTHAVECARQVCAMFDQRKFRREPFLVGVSDRRISRHSTDQEYFHYAMLKAFEASKLAYVFDLCYKWWLQGGGAPGKAPAQPPPKVQAAPVQPPPVQPPPVQPPSPVAQEPSRQVQQASRTQIPWASPPAPVRSTGPASGQQPAHAPPARSGNSIESLDSLRPPRPPFEDVTMTCLVGRGSFGRVYRARWDASIVALKVVEHYDQGKPAIMAFEGAVSTSLAHPNLVQTFKYAIRDTCPADNQRSESANAAALKGFEVWIVQEWCGMGTLNQKIFKGGVLERGGFPHVIEVCTEVTSAASYLHSRGIIHGDLTTSNILLVERPCPKGYVTKVSDFGLARVLDNGASGVNTASMGTVTYMPPELFQLEGCALTKKVDVYAFGVVLWQLCTSEAPFAGLLPTQVVVMVAQGAALQLPADVPEQLAKVFKESTARRPADRPGFDKLVRDLLAILAFEP